MSLPDINDFLESYYRREKKRLKEELSVKHFQAKDIGQYVAVAFHGTDNVQIQELWDFFPELFEEERQQHIQSQMTVYKAQMIDFAYRNNHVRGGK